MKMKYLSCQNYCLTIPSKIRIYGEWHKIYNCYNFPYAELEFEKLIKKRRSGIEVIYNSINSFDIETTTYHVDGTDKAFMYCWGFCINGVLVVGRLWNEFIYFLKHLQLYLNLDSKHKLVIYIHNASFEFQFCYQFLQKFFQNFKVFATNKRKVVYFSVDGFEFRCSYKLTNMSLDKAVKKEKGTKYHKMVGDLDYTKFRIFCSLLTYTEWCYFIGDLLSLYDLIRCKLKNENNTLWTIPLTSTGYIRSYLRERTRQDKKYYYFFKRFSLTDKVYKMCKDQLKGGDTHANRFYQGELIE